MQLKYRLILTSAPLTALVALPATAQSIDVQIAIPRMKVAEYHAPYVAMWVERPGTAAKTLAIWYDTDNREDGGKKWLTDVRQWWRASGRSLNLPANGVSGATRAPGTHRANLSGAGLTPGQYTLAIEAAREGGGREVLRLPFAWPPKPGQRAAAKGTTELGAVALAFR